MEFSRKPDNGGYIPRFVKLESMLHNRPSGELPHRSVGLCVF